MAQKQNFLAEALHVFVLVSFAMAEPVLYLVSRRTVFLLDHGIEPPALVTLALGLGMLIPGLIVLAEFLLGRWSQAARERTHIAVVACALLLIVLPVAKRLKFLNGIAIVFVSLLLAVMGAVAYRRWTIARHFVTAASPAVLIFPAVFFFSSPLTRLLFPEPPPAPAHVRVGNAAPVVMVVFDEFCGTSLMDEHHQIDSDRYPNFAALAREATWYRNATSVHQRTDSAVPSILTGRYPQAQLLPTDTHHPENLFAWMLSADYELAVFEPYTRLYPKAAELEGERPPPPPFGGQLGALVAPLPSVYLSYLLPSDLPFGRPDIPRQWFGIKSLALLAKPDENRRSGVFRYDWDIFRDDQLRHLLHCIARRDRPALYFLHVALPHHPWCYLPSGRAYLPDDGTGERMYGVHGDFLETWPADELSVAHAYQRYLLQVGYVDHLVGKLMARLREVDLYDRSLIIITGDHGVSFRPNLSRRAPTAVSVPDIASVPLFIKLPGQQHGGTDDRPVESIDILPTVVDVLGLEVDFDMDGRSLARAARPEPSDRLFQGDLGQVRLDVHFESKYETLERMLSMFGSDEDSDRFFAIGPRNELVGRDVKDLNPGGRSSLDTEIIFPPSQPMEKWRGIVPCYFEGQVHAKTDTGEKPIELAIAVNGTIRATTRTYLESDKWTAMVPEQCLQDGVNEIEVFQLTSANGEPALSATSDGPHRVTYAR